MIETVAKSNTLNFSIPENNLSDAEDKQKYKEFEITE